jgi:phage protein D
MAIDTAKLLTDMALAASGVFKERWPSVSAFVEGAFQNLAGAAADIEQKFRAGEISQDEARILLDMQRDAASTVLLAAKGMTQLMTEQAINAALDVVKNTLNAALGIALL